MKTYSINAECSNCDWSGSISLPKGEPVGYAMLCPNCGCNTCRKQVKFIPKITKFPPYIPPNKDKWIQDPYHKSPYRITMDKDDSAWMICSKN